MNENLFSHPAEAENDATDRDTATSAASAEPAYMPVFSHRDK
jgi:hypothetical protein